MASITYSIMFLLNLLFLSNALGKYVLSSESNAHQKVQTSETAAQRLGCQQYVAQGYQAIDGAALHNVKVQKHNDDLQSFEMHFAIETGKNGTILLMSEPNNVVFELVIETQVGLTAALYLKQNGWRMGVGRYKTDRLISTAGYSKLYIKMHSGNTSMSLYKYIANLGFLDIGMDIGFGMTKLISLGENHVSSIKYFDISSDGPSGAKFLYDCPAVTDAGNTAN